jgi:hypothetical protein
MFVRVALWLPVSLTQSAAGWPIDLLRINIGGKLAFVPRLLNRRSLGGQVAQTRPVGS